ncbi:MAG: cytochrome-c oxidase, cbb3-type subunit I [Deltaproteobacteria bacterium]|nr:cytochrome-c oxidase, cbb3-type subunit I [Deltaproteobacteria bacterium]
MTQNVSVTYDDKTPRMFLWATLIFGLIGMLVGVLIALQLAWWPANAGISWLTFGRLRPLHTNAMVFAFSANAFFAGMYYCTQRLLATRMWSDKLSAIHFWGWQLIILLVTISLPLGITQSKEYAEMEWWIDIPIAIIWVIMSVNFFATIAIRKIRHLYVAIWFFIGSILTIAMLHVVNALAIPVDWFHSYPALSGVKDALVQWWYGHNAVGFLLTTPFLGLMYYFVPKAANQPVYSYRLSIIHFWSLIFIYIWAGPHHLLYTALPEWIQSLGMVFSLMLIAPSWGGMLNGLLTMRGVWHKVRTDPILKFFVLSLTFYGMATLEGPLMSIKSLNLITHYTDYTIAHVHGGALGWLGGLVFGMTYYLVPRLWKTELYSVRLANQHFWSSLIGILLYVTSMWAAGITQALMWFAEDESGLLRYPIFMETVQAISPLFWMRLLGGLIYVWGLILCFYNVLMTVRTGSAQDNTVVTVKIHDPLPPKTGHEKIENKGLIMTVLAFVAVLIGGIVEFMPTFFIDSVIPKTAGIRPYTPLELAGRDLYVREGCHNCHSQMIRTYEKEIRRYGRVSEAGEFIYDFPSQWGSKRTGPDLHRTGGKYPDLWHYNHMRDPRSTSPGSIMPAYPWLASRKADLAILPRKLTVMKMLGVPYTDEDIASATEQARMQSRKHYDQLKKDVRDELTEDSELIALIAYLQRLGTREEHSNGGSE